MPSAQLPPLAAAKAPGLPPALACSQPLTRRPARPQRRSPSAAPWPGRRRSERGPCCPARCSRA
eukprot:1857081-Lingulodinium_polyedra.AAC.1